MYIISCILCLACPWASLALLSPWALAAPSSCILICDSVFSAYIYCTPPISTSTYIYTNVFGVNDIYSYDSNDIVRRMCSLRSNTAFRIQEKAGNRNLHLAHSCLVMINANTIHACVCACACVCMCVCVDMCAYIHACLSCVVMSGMSMS